MTKKTPTPAAEEKPRHIERQEDERLLKCWLTEADLLTEGRRLADARGNLDALENEAEEWKTQHKAKVTQETGQIAVSASKIRSGYEHRHVLVEILKDYDHAIISVVRLDNKETVESRTMTTHERQMGLPLQEEDRIHGDGDYPLTIPD